MHYFWSFCCVSPAEWPLRAAVSGRMYLAGHAERAGTRARLGDAPGVGGWQDETGFKAGLGGICGMKEVYFGASQRGGRHALRRSCRWWVDARRVARCAGRGEVGICGRRLLGHGAIRCCRPHAEQGRQGSKAPAAAVDWRTEES